MAKPKPGNTHPGASPAGSAPAPASPTAESAWTKALPEPPAFADIRDLFLPDRLARAPTFYSPSDDAHCVKWQVVPVNLQHGLIVREIRPDDPYLEAFVRPQELARRPVVVRSLDYFLEEVDGVLKLEMTADAIWLFQRDGSTSYGVDGDYVYRDVDPNAPDTLGVRNWYLTREACLHAPGMAPCGDKCAK